MAFGHREEIVTVLVLLWLVTTTILGEEDNKTPQKNPIVRIMTYNLNFGGSGTDLAIAIIKDSHADLVFLQETTTSWEKNLNQNLNKEYAHSQFHQATGAGGQGLLSRWPITEDKWMKAKVEGSWFPAWRVIIQTPVGALQILAVHLRPPLGEKGVDLKALVTTGNIRVKEIEAHAATLQKGLPTIILGDFNDEGGPITWLKEKGYRNALAEFDTTTPTWHWKTSFTELTGRYDHLCYSEALVCQKAWVVQAGASDHYPVIGDFSLNISPNKTP
jgi:endonuclease/exonuclease/phosphatase family metal-dependent hydrolase